MEQIARVLAKDLGSRGITVNTISPGPVDTPLFREGKPQQVVDMIAKQNPSKRLGEPEDIAPMVSFIVSPAAQWVNGQNIRVNGVSVSLIYLANANRPSQGICGIMALHILKNLFMYLGNRLSHNYDLIIPCACKAWDFPAESKRVRTPASRDAFDGTWVGYSVLHS